MLRCWEGEDAGELNITSRLPALAPKLAKCVFAVKVGNMPVSSYLPANMGKCKLSQTTGVGCKC